MASLSARQYVARLVLKYLELEHFQDTLNAFMKDGAELLQASSTGNEGEKTLYEIVDEYTKLKNEEVAKERMASAFSLHFPGLPIKTFSKLNALLDDYILCKESVAQALVEPKRTTTAEIEVNNTASPKGKKTRKTSAGGAAKPRTRKRNANQTTPTVNTATLMPPPPRIPNRLTQILPRPNPNAAQPNSFGSPNAFTFFPLALPPSFMAAMNGTPDPLLPGPSPSPQPTPPTNTTPSTPTMNNTTSATMNNINTTTTTNVNGGTETVKNNFANGKDNRGSSSSSAAEKRNRSRRFGSSPKRRKVMQTTTVVSPKKKEVSTKKRKNRSKQKQTTTAAVDGAAPLPPLEIREVNEDMAGLEGLGGEDEELDLASFLDEEHFMRLLNSPELHEKLAAHINKTIAVAGTGPDNNYNIPTPSPRPQNNNPSFPTTPYRPYTNNNNGTTSKPTTDNIPPVQDQPASSLSPATTAASPTPIVKIDMVPIEEIIDSLSQDPVFNSIFEWPPGQEKNPEAGGTGTPPDKSIVNPEDAPTTDVHMGNTDSNEGNASLSGQNGAGRTGDIQQFDNKIKEMDVEAFLSRLTYAK